ncbi:MAG TPA: polysaccharide deacetylase family protein [Longimicrobium sp.]|nr:polysaccharide deacetylase family protein [Longimicrobium sp.]
MPGACGAHATLRAAARRAAERWLAASPLPALLARGRGGAVILAYHNVIPAGERVAGDRSLHLREEDFAAQLDVLQRTCNVLPLNELMSPGDGRPRVALTFDDAYSGAAQAGVRELARRGLPATFFVVAGAAAGTHFWWDRMAGGNGLDASLRAHALGSLGGRGDRILASAGEVGHEPTPGGVLHRAADVALCPAPLPTATNVSGMDLRAATLPAHAAAAGDDELRAAARVPGITLASHGWSHADLAALREDELRTELNDSLVSLRRRFGNAVIPWISYPYGRVSPAVVHAAREAGYRGGLRVEGGAVRRGDDPLALPRINVPAGVSVDGFRLRARGWEVGRWRASW